MWIFCLLMFKTGMSLGMAIEPNTGLKNNHVPLLLNLMATVIGGITLYGLKHIWWIGVDMLDCFLKIFFGGFYIFSYYIQHCFICRPSDSTVPNPMLGSNPGPLHLVHWQSDALTTGLDLICWIAGLFLYGAGATFVCREALIHACEKGIKRAAYLLCNNHKCLTANFYPHV